LVVVDPAPPAPPPGLAPAPPLRPPAVVPPRPALPEATVTFPIEDEANPAFEGVVILLFTPGPPPAANVPFTLDAGATLVEATALNQVLPPAVGGVVLFAGPPEPFIPTE